MPMLANISELLDKLKLAVDAEKYDEAASIDKELGLLFAAYFDSDQPHDSKELSVVVDQYNILTEHIHTLKKSTFLQLAQYQKNQKKLKNYRNV
jgi:uncharacterized protein YktB (UPF0637 family)